ncbi:hypothetical protein FSARC_5184 [Fusarium sarcochroum]|uniref:Cytochrome P450 n=1 Tax=Fusarium sarcochroum TaxID=1208366 RepID=A0A8H4U055_9HYPO|nr:hypothetical protein FSARC_5184 [Fusarium sarcochroum]
MDLSSLYRSALASFGAMPLAYKFLFAILTIVTFNKLFPSKPKRNRLLPTWAPIEIAIVSHLCSGNGLGRRILSSISQYGGSLFGVTSGHQIFADLPGVDRLLAQSYHTFDAEPPQYTLCTRVFGCVDTPELKVKLNKSMRDLLPPLERTFLNDAASTAAVEKSGVARRGASLVTFSSDTERMERWELSAGIKVIQPELPGSPGKVEANLQSLIRDFGACMSIPLLYGQDLLDRHDTLLDDFWTFDNDLFPLLMVGIPTWAPFKMMQDGLKARARIINQLEGFWRRLDQHQRGEPVDFGADVSDASITVNERNKIYNRDGWTFAERAAADLGTFWGLNANTQPVLFWFITHVFSTPGLVERVREEIAPYVILSKGDRPEIASIDLPGLFRNCQLVKACIYETYRMVNEPTSLRCLARPISIDDGDLKHNLDEGTFISVPLALSNKDPSIYAEPDKFVPDRFLETDPETGKSTAKYGRLKPWGLGAAMCKGRTFAEKEIISLGSAVVSLWDISPASESWELPDMIPGTGVKKPVKDIRVAIQRRVID